MAIHIHIPTDEEIQYMDVMHQGFEAKMVSAMAYIRDIQGLSIEDVVSRFSNVNPELLRRYMRPSYDRTRPIHFMAAFSWATAVPATTFYLGSKIMEEWRGMDDAAVESLAHIGSMPYQQFDILIACIFQYLSDEGKTNIEILKGHFYNDVGEVNADVEAECSAPDIIDLGVFSKSYYRSIALTVSKFRVENGLTVDLMARVLGLSEYQYSELEKPDHSMAFSLLVGGRMRIGFRLKSHAFFTKEMDEYPLFHRFRLVQEYRESLLLESLKYVKEESRQYVIEIVKVVAKVYKSKS